MAILDQLMEKKDLTIYIDERIKQLSNMDLLRICSKHRENAKKKAEGKVCELKKIKHLISQGTLKKTAIRLWEQNRKKPVWDEIKAASKLVDDSEKCPKCHTGKDWAVVGYVDMYCKCESDKLAKTERAKDFQKIIQGLFNLDIKPTDKGVIGKFNGIDVVVSDLSFDIGHEERKKCAKKILKDLSNIKCDFSSLRRGNLEDLKTDDFERMRRKNGLNPKKELPEDKKSLLSEEDKRILREGTLKEAIAFLDKTDPEWFKEASKYLKSIHSTRRNFLYA